MKVAFQGSFHTNFTELAPVEVNPISMGTSLPKDTFKKTAVVLAVTACPETVIETELAFKTEDPKKYDPVDVMDKYPDHGLDVIEKALLETKPGAIDTFTLYLPDLVTK